MYICRDDAKVAILKYSFEKYLLLFTEGTKNKFNRRNEVVWLLLSSCMSVSFFLVTLNTIHRKSYNRPDEHELVNGLYFLQ